MEEVESGAEAMTRPSRAHAEGRICVQGRRGSSFPLRKWTRADRTSFTAHLAPLMERHGRADARWTMESRSAQRARMRGYS
jgi:hypothetical protein